MSRNTPQESKTVLADRNSEQSATSEVAAIDNTPSYTPDREVMEAEGAEPVKREVDTRTINAALGTKVCVCLCLCCCLTYRQSLDQCRL